MKYLLSISIFLFSYQLMAFSPELVEKKVKNFSIDVSKNCKDKCHAIRAVEKLKAKHFSKLKKDVYGGKTIGNIICRKLFSAKVKYYRDDKKNEQHFCLFKDGSYLPVGEFDYLESELVSKSELIKK